MWRDLPQYLQALRRQIASLVTGAFVTSLLLILQYAFKVTELPTWVLGSGAVLGVFVAGFQAWREEHAKVLAAQPADMRIGDRAKQFRRMLAASFEGHGSDGPTENQALVSWAMKYASGFKATGPAIEDLKDLSPDSSPGVRGAVERADRDYYASADLINPLMKQTGVFVVDQTNREAVLRDIREAVKLVRQCMATLDTIATK